MNLNIQELSLDEIDQVSGAGLDWKTVVAIGDLAVDFAKGFIAGVNAAA